MSKIYRQKDGITVASGKVKSISEDRMNVVLTTSDYDRTAKKSVDTELNIVLNIPLDDSIRTGYDVTVAGYPHGKGTFMAESILVGNDIYQTQDLAIITGFVASAKYNEEKNPDGTQKMKQDGVTPRKPHYDISVAIQEEGKRVWHQIAVYDNPQYNPDAIEKAKKLFGRFDKDSNRIRVTFVTKPGDISSYVTHGQNGVEYTNYSCRHMGYISVDVDYIDQKEKAKNTPSETKEAPQSTQTQQTSAPEPAPASQEMNGLNEPLAMEDDELFK